MPSQLHEMLLLLFRNRPKLAAELLRDALSFPVPEYTEARIESAELSNVQPAEYRADLVVLLMDAVPVLGIVVEVQLATDDDKRFAWPAYAVNLRSRIRCGVVVLVVAADDRIARWSRRSIHLGGGNQFKPLVLGPTAVPIVVDENEAKRDPELSVLSAIAHGKRVKPATALRIALAAMGASVGLDADRSVLYFDLIVASLGDAARRSLQAMDPAKYEFQSEFAKRYLAEGEAKGEARGEARGRAEKAAQIVLKLLRLKFGDVSSERVMRVQKASVEELDLWAERILSANTIEGVMDDVDDQPANAT